MRMINHLLLTHIDGTRTTAAPAHTQKVHTLLGRKLTSQVYRLSFHLVSLGFLAGSQTAQSVNFCIVLTSTVGTLPVDFSWRLISSQLLTKIFLGKSVLFRAVQSLKRLGKALVHLSDPVKIKCATMSRGQRQHQHHQYGRTRRKSLGEKLEQNRSG